MSDIAEKLTTIAENQQKIYDKGMRDKEDQFWEEVQKGGTRANYIYGFCSWDCEYIRPKYKVVPTSTVHHLFLSCQKLKKIEAQYFDLSNVPINYITSSQGISVLANGCFELEEIEDIGLKVGMCYQAFSNCYKLKKIAKITVDEKSTFTDCFKRCDSLEDITFEGVIGQNISFADSPLLSDASLENIAQHLKDFLPEWKEGDGDKAIITLHATVKERIKNTEIENLIKSKKWGIA